MLRNIPFPQFMKNFLGILALGLSGFAGTILADDFRSIVIPGDGTGTTSHSLPRGHGDQFMVIRNFTQEDGGTSGIVMVSKPPSSLTPVKVLAAAILDPTA